MHDRMTSSPHGLMASCSEAQPPHYGDHTVEQTARAGGVHRTLCSTCAFVWMYRTSCVFISLSSSSLHRGCVPPLRLWGGEGGRGGRRGRGSEARGQTCNWPGRRRGTAMSRAYAPGRCAARQGTLSQTRRLLIAGKMASCLVCLHQPPLASPSTREGQSVL